jgi:hypothetical protein
VTAIRGLQTFRHLHACPSCFRLERSPGGACTRWISAALSRRTWKAVVRHASTDGYRNSLSCLWTAVFEIELLSGPLAPVSRRDRPGDAPQKFGSQLTPRWREADSNPRSPVRKDLCKRLPPIASIGGAALRHSRRVEGFRDAASEDSGCEVALQVLGSLPVTSSRPFIGEPR